MYGQLLIHRLLCWQRPILPGSFPPSIFGTGELNFRVRDGNGWGLTVINTGSFPWGGVCAPWDVYMQSLRTVYQRIGDPCGNRTRVTGVRGRCLNRLTNGPHIWTSVSFYQKAFLHALLFGAPSGTRTQDPLIKSQLLYQLS